MPSSETLGITFVMSGRTGNTATDEDGLPRSTLVRRTLRCSGETGPGYALLGLVLIEWPSFLFPQEPGSAGRDRRDWKDPASDDPGTPRQTPTSQPSSMTTATDRTSPSS